MVIVGPTCSGKTALALQLAEKFNGEIIAADSRTVYRGMDIGTAKASAADRARVPHHLIDIIEPAEAFTAADFKARATLAIDQISDRGKLPIMVGGTGLYIDSVIYDFTFRGPGDATERKRLEVLSVEALQELLKERNIALPENVRNPRHLIRQLETGGVAAGRRQMRANTLIIGLATTRERLEERIVHRVDAMLAGGLIDEARSLAGRYGWECPALQTIGYQEIRSYIIGVADLQSVRTAIIRDTLAYAKRQRTWFKRNISIHWCTQQVEVEDLITTFLSK